MTKTTRDRLKKQTAQALNDLDRCLYNLGVLIGALTMEQWEIRIDLKTGELDLEGLRRREFTEL